MRRVNEFVIAAALLAALPTVACGGDDGDSGDKSTGGDTNGETGGTGAGGSGTGGDGSGGDGTGGDGMGGDGTGGSDSAVAFFTRIATYPVCMQLDETCDDDTGTAAEISTASEDGMTVIYTDSPSGVIGFVDITDPDAPDGLGTLDVGGEPTSVSVKGDFALVGVVDEDSTFVAPAGALAVVDIDERTVVRTIDVGGQPDSVAVSPDRNFAVVVLENQRDEDLNDGEIPQLPAGSIVIVDLSDANPDNWTTENVALTGLTTPLYPTDPEPEFVDINANNIAAVTLQENNGIVLVDLAEAEVLEEFSAGSVDLEDIDADDNDNISMVDSLSDLLREPDGVAWIGTEFFATANEGDLNGGSRSFSIWSAEGEVVYDSGNMLDHLAARLGHYPDGRSDAKGVEPENIEYGVFGDEQLLFVNLERASLTVVFDVAEPDAPVFKQALPAALGPEGGLAISARDLFVVSSEEDDRAGPFRGGLNVYEYGAAASSYPTLQSADRSDGTPIPWAAMSGTVGGADGMLYAVEDSAFTSNRIFTIDTKMAPPTITAEFTITDENDVFANAAITDDVGDDALVFSSADLAAMINDDGSVNIDPEGISLRDGGGFWVASEGAGSVNDVARPVTSLNFVFGVTAAGVIDEVIALPAGVNDDQIRFGFEGVAEYDGKLYVAFQRTWVGDTAGKVRIGIYDLQDDTWEFVFYTLDAVASQNGGWVGLSEITSLGEGIFLLVERDNQHGPDAAIKKIYQIDLSSYTPDGDVTKTLARDLMPDLAAAGGLIIEKVESCAVDSEGDVWIMTDNDGVNDNSGETQLIKLGAL